MTITLLKSFNTPPVDRPEIMRYAGQKGSILALEEMVEECLKEALPVLNYNVCYKIVSCEVVGDETVLEGEKIMSRTLAKNLSGCTSAVLISATLGMGIDRLIEKYKVISPLKALVMHAVGVERIESLLNAFCSFLEVEVAQGKALRPRFSAGYGDFKLEHQKLFFDKLESTKLLGLTLNESMIMSPSKSVTAIVGLVDCDLKTKEHQCENCDDIECEFRR